MGFGSMSLFLGQDWDTGHERKVDTGHPSIGLLAQCEELATRLGIIGIELLLGQSARVLENTRVQRPTVAPVSIGERREEWNFGYYRSPRPPGERHEKSPECRA
eukprot:scaffold11046_cov183-Amphora_coffeaeformis.AAC.18